MLRYLSAQKWTLAALAVSSCLLLFRITTIVPNLTSTEYKTVASAATWHDIVQNPLHAPLKLLQFLTTLLPAGHQALFDRLPSVILGLCATMIFVYITNRWYGKRTAFFGFVLLATAAWFLHVARFAGVDVEYVFAILALLAVHVGIHDHNDRPLMTYVWLIVNLMLLYIPGLAWFVALSALWEWRSLMQAWRHLGRLWSRVIWVLCIAAGVGGLVYTFIRHTALIKAWAGLPASFTSWQHTLRYIGESFTALMYQAPANPELWLGRLPLLDVVTIVLLIMGICSYIRHWRAQRTHLLLAYTVLAGVLAGLHGTVTLSVLIPTIYLITAAGTAYALHFWLRVFPRNPVARGIGIAMIATLIGLASFYNLRQYFVAWPHSGEVVGNNSTVTRADG